MLKCAIKINISLASCTNLNDTIYHVLCSEILISVTIHVWPTYIFQKSKLFRGNRKLTVVFIKNLYNKLKLINRITLESSNISFQISVVILLNMISPRYIDDTPIIKFTWYFESSNPPKTPISRMLQLQCFSWSYLKKYIFFLEI